MDWCESRKFQRVLENIASRLHSKSFRFKRLDPVVFLCGGANSYPRDSLAKYLRKMWPHLLVFYADDVWNTIANTSNLNALQMEELLAALSDLVIILVESPGTFTELGAFSLSVPLRRKLLPILDRQRKNSPSFINSGPIQWIDADSQFSPSVWVNPDEILSAAQDIEERINRIPPEISRRVDNVALSPKHVLFLVCDLVSILGPCDQKTVSSLLCKILKSDPLHEIKTLLALGKSLGLIREFEHCGKRLFFTPLDTNGRLPSFHRNKFVDIPGLRAEVVSVMLLFSSATQALRIAKESE